MRGHKLPRWSLARPRRNHSEALLLLPIRVPGFPQLSSVVPGQAEEKSQRSPPSSTDPGARVPPIVIRDKTKWCGVSSEIKRKGYNFIKAQNTIDGIRVFPATEADFRGMVKFFNSEKVPYHTYQLPSEKVLNVVIRGIPSEIPEQEVMMQLRELGFSPDSVVRMRKTRNGAPMPLILVKISKDQRKIYNLKELVSLDVSVETLRAKPSIGQCHRCQRYGHAQSRCTAQRKCVSCGGEHPSGECPRPKSEPPTCANCGESHPANYRGCVRCPKPKTVPTRAAQTPKPVAPPATSFVQPASFVKTFPGYFRFHLDSDTKTIPGYFRFHLDSDTKTT
ncbi:zinc finger associated protein [Popillia japonica]|uniref:Zinc finger associated protein n=1 Tax=Popillia japonica TaxID=7064 RepID=A0AAW1MC19_POPJA